MSFVQAAKSWVPDVTHGGDNATRECYIYEQKLPVFNMQNFPVESTVMKIETGSDLVHVERSRVLR